MEKVIDLIDASFEKLNSIGEFLPQLAFRLILAFEFFEAGVEKFRGTNWFTQIHNQFPFPFNFVSSDFSWFLATWTELAGSLLLVIGFATRFTSVSLIILDLVAWYTVHASSGYNVCSNGYKLPLIYLAMFLPLLFSGAGKLSVDHYIARKYL